MSLLCSVVVLLNFIKKNFIIVNKMVCNFGTNASHKPYLNDSNSVSEDCKF